MKIIDQTSKTNWKFIAVVAVFAILVVGGVLLLKGMQPAPISAPDEQSTISNQQSTIDTSDWQTYRNDEFGFEVEYPANWSIIGETTSQPAFSPDGKV